MTHQCQSTIRVDRAVPSRAYPVSYRERTDLSMATEDGSGHTEFRKCAEFPSPRANAQTRDQAALQDHKCSMSYFMGTKL